MTGRDLEVVARRRVDAIGRKLRVLNVDQRVTAMGERDVHVVFDGSVTGVYLTAGDHVGALQIGADTIRVTGRNSVDVADDILLTLRSGDKGKDQ